MVRMARAVGWIGGDPDSSYGLLEAIDVNGDVLCDWNVPTPRAFSQLKKKLNIVVERPHDE